MEIAIAVLIGMFIGMFACAWRIRAKTLGTIKMARSDPDEPPYLFLELKTSANDIMDHKIVMFEVSQK